MSASLLDALTTILQLISFKTHLETAIKWLHSIGKLINLPIFLAEWAATLITCLPYTPRISRLVDKLLVIAEGGEP